MVQTNECTLHSWGVWTCTDKLLFCQIYSVELCYTIQDVLREYILFEVICFVKFLVSICCIIIHKQNIWILISKYSCIIFSLWNKLAIFQSVREWKWKFHWCIVFVNHLQSFICFLYFDFDMIITTFLSLSFLLS